MHTNISQPPLNAIISAVVVIKTPQFPSQVFPRFKSAWSRLRMALLAYSESGGGVILDQRANYEAAVLLPEIKSDGWA